MPVACIVPTEGIVPVETLGTTGTRYTTNVRNIGILPNMIVPVSGIRRY